MRFRSILMVAPIVLCGMLAMGVACEWDYDTLQMERQRFPQMLELITGKFLRHSPEFYQWRIADRLQRIERGEKSVRLYDDLAVAYDKTGQHDKAIAEMLKKEQIQPGLYETHANLGTFYIHNGQYEEGLKHLKQALALEPDAHFGRERYQQYLVEYLLSKREDDKTPLPLSKEPRQAYRISGFADYVLKQRGIRVDSEEFKAEVELALQGVMGMLRFGNHQHPVLLEAAGDLLLADPNEDGKRLAARAYLKAAASQEAREADAASAYETMAEQAINLQARQIQTTTQLTLDEVRSAFVKEQQDADAWTAAVYSDEKSWIDNDNLNPDEEFTKKYYNEPNVLDASTQGSTTVVAESGPLSQQTLGIVLAVFVVFGGMLVGYGVLVARR